MPEAMPATFMIGLYGVIALLLLLVGMVWRTGRRLVRLERFLAAAVERQPTETAESQEAVGGAFGQFLEEDPARKELSKAEQFAAFRQWRQQQGMTWTPR